MWGKGWLIFLTQQKKSLCKQKPAVGSGQKAEDGTVTPLDVKKGDKVLIGKWFIEVTIDSIDYVIVKETDIMGIVS